MDAGFAAAVQPVSEETRIHTDAEGLSASEIKIPVAEDVIPGYRAMPTSGGRFPAVLVVHEIFGVHEYIRDVCRRLAKLGYFAVAPDLFLRQGDVSKLTDHQEIVSTVVSKVPDSQVFEDLDATVAFAEDAGADTSRLGLTGFCWGGRIAWLYAAHSAMLQAAVAWYGKLEPPRDPLHPQTPLDVASGLRCPVLGLYGADDPGIPLESIDRIREAARLAHKDTSIIVYPDAGHAFHADYRPSYYKAAAEDGWLRLKEWFHQHGVA
jgi:carboxymethylenebutenolidase